MTGKPKTYRAPKAIWFLVNCLFGLLLEEVQLAIKSFKPTSAFMKFQQRKEFTKFHDLTEQEKKMVIKFCDVKEEEDRLKFKMLHLESSVQLTFYFTLLLFNVYEVPLLNMNYNEQRLNIASTKWISGLIWFLVKTLLSGFSTFSPIFRILQKDSYTFKGSPPNIVQYICLTLNVLLDLLFAAGITFLEWFFTYKN